MPVPVGAVPVRFTTKFVPLLGERQAVLRGEDIAQGLGLEGQVGDGRS